MGRFTRWIDSLSFELAAKIAFREASKQAGAVILEPIMKLEVITPEVNMGDVIGDLNRRRGQMQGMSEKGGAQVVKAFVPLSMMFGYVTDLRTITSGRATSTMEFNNYDIVPAAKQKEIMEKVNGTSKA